MFSYNTKRLDGSNMVLQSLFTCLKGKEYLFCALWHIHREKNPSALKMNTPLMETKCTEQVMG